MDFSQVSSISIPEGDVAKIQIGGVTVWESGWGTLVYSVGSGQTTREYKIKSEIDFNKLCGQGTVITFSDGTTITKSGVTEFHFGNTPNEIGPHFLYSCPSLTYLSTIPENVVTIGSSFLSNCAAFNSPIIIGDNVTSLGSGFLYQCSSFNSTIVLSDNITALPNNFMASCSAFNQEIVLPSHLVTIGNSFMLSCRSYAHPLTVPSTVTSVGSAFMAYCVNFTGTLTINTTAALTGYHEQTLTPGDASALMYTRGVTITGPGASIWKSALPNKTSHPYRKLILK